MSLIVLDSGFHSLLVGESCWDLRPFGVPSGGPADVGSWILGNALVGNKESATAIEVTLKGPTLRATKSLACVVFGAEFQIRINGTEIEANKTFTLQADDVLKIGGVGSGCRAYLSVAGGFSNKLTSEAVVKDMVLECREARIGRRSYDNDLLARRASKGPFVLRTIAGPQCDWFPDEAFWQQTYTVGNDSNRMGLRLQGVPIPAKTGEIASEPVSPGAVQIVNDGTPIILGVDGQTIGGYPKIAHVIRADMDIVGQLRPKDRVKFERVTPEEAEVAQRERLDRLRDLTRRAIWSNGVVFL